MSGARIGGEIAGLVGGLEGKNPDLAAAGRVKAAWNRIADSRVRPHVVAVYVVPGTGAAEVVVYTDTPLWASELSMQSELMRLKLNVELARMGAAGAGGEGQVAKIRFSPSKEKYLARDRRLSTHDELAAADSALAGVEPEPLTEAEDAALREASSRIEDGRLREAAYGAAKSSLEWHRGLERAGL